MRLFVTFSNTLQDTKNTLFHYRSGKPFTKECKQIVVNVYQSIINEGKSMAFSIKKASKMVGVSSKSVERFIKEKVETGELRDHIGNILLSFTLMTLLYITLPYTNTVTTTET